MDIRYQKPVPIGVKSLLLAWLEDVRPANGHYPQAEEIHQLRVCMKRLRAAAQLLRGFIGDKAADKLDRTCAKLAKKLGNQRDNVALEEALNRLTQAYPSPCGLHLQTVLAAVPVVDDQEFSWADMASSWMQIYSQCSDLSLDALKRGQLKRQLKRNLHRLEPQLRKSLRHPDTRRLHNGRKQVKNLYYQYELLSLDNDKSRMLRRLGQLLGDIHDVDMLQLRLQLYRDRYWQEDANWLIHSVSAERQRWLAECVQCARSIFGDTVYS